MKLLQEISISQDRILIIFFHRCFQIYNVKKFDVEQIKIAGELTIKADLCFRAFTLKQLQFALRFNISFCNFKPEALNGNK